MKNEITRSHFKFVAQEFMKQYPMIEIFHTTYEDTCTIRFHYNIYRSQISKNKRQESIIPLDSPYIPLPSYEKETIKIKNQVPMYPPMSPECI